MIVGPGEPEVPLEHALGREAVGRVPLDLVGEGDARRRLVVGAEQEPAGRLCPLDVADAGTRVDAEVLRLAVAHDLRREADEERLTIPLEREQLRGPQARRIAVLEPQRLRSVAAKVEGGGARGERRPRQRVRHDFVARRERERRVRVDPRGHRQQIQGMPVAPRILLQRPAEQHGASGRELRAKLVRLHDDASAAGRAHRGRQGWRLRSGRGRGPAPAPPRAGDAAPLPAPGACAAAVLVAAGAGGWGGRRGAKKLWYRSSTASESRTACSTRFSMEGPGELDAVIETAVAAPGRVPSHREGDNARAAGWRATRP